MSGEIWTIGHSNRTLEAFIHLLGKNGLGLVADVRGFPASRKHPQFNQETLQKELAKAEIGYRHFPALGGRRSKRVPGSVNTAWHVESFNSYADHMGTPEFESSLAELIALAREQHTVLMCAEALPWRCHRRLIADALLVRGWQVWDILGAGKAKQRSLTPFACVRAGRLIYPAGSSES